MKCPSCGVHVGASEVECHECGAHLGASQEEPPDPDMRLVSLVRSGDAAQIALIKSLLESEDIEYLVRGEGVQDLFGWGRVGAGYNIVTGPAEFVVKEEDVERARELLRDMFTPVPDEDERE